MSYIYIISNEKHFKIGFSKNPQRRLAQLQTGCPDKLSLKYSLEIEIAPIHIIEKIMHKQCPKKVSGEWFDGNLDELVSLLNFVKMRYDNEDTEFQYKHKILNFYA